MKRILTIITGLCIAASSLAQSPNKISYQAVVRDASDALIATTAVGMQISILQNSVSGDAVYTETQTPSTNANGLISIAIGTGTSSDDFSTIDWSDGPYFIKTETDPAGGTDYTITGTSELMSVPFALYANVADSVAGVSTNQYSVGDYAQGGVVIWVDASGQHGLISAIEESSSLKWSAGTTSAYNLRTMATGDGMYSGAMNTAIILSAQGEGEGDDYAALVCAEYQKTDNGITYGDWYLPSKYELNIVFNNRTIIESVSIANGGSGFAAMSDMYYWSSTEASQSNAWLQNFNETSNNQYNFIAKHASTGYAIRAVRSF